MATSASATIASSDDVTRILITIATSTTIPTMSHGFCRHGFYRFG